MNLTSFRAIRITFYIILFLGVLTGCATYPHSHEDKDDDEGGISGTGNKVNCELTKNRNRPECQEKQL